MSTRSTSSRRSHTSHKSHSSHKSHKSHTSHHSAPQRSAVTYHKTVVLHANKVTGVRRARHVRATSLAGYGIHRPTKIKYARGRGQQKHVKGLEHTTTSHRTKLRVNRMFGGYHVAGRRKKL